MSLTKHRRDMRKHAVRAHTLQLQIAAAGITPGKAGILHPAPYLSHSVTIDIDRLTEAELIELNHRVVARLKFLNDRRAHASMLEFRIGEKVRFRPDGHSEVIGIITKYNRKSVTVIAENGQLWNVAPMLLGKTATEPQAATAPVIGLPKK